MPSSINLPWEIWIKVLSFLDEFATLKSFAQTCKRNHEIVNQSSSLLHYRISLKLGYGHASTFGSAAPVYPEQLEVGPWKSNDEFDSSASLSQTLHCQKTMMKSIFKDVRNWEDFAKIRHQIEKNWYTGKGQWTTLCKAVGPPQIWRFKFDPEYNYWACVSLEGKIEVISSFEPNHCRRWLATPRVFASSTHLESSGPFIVTNTHHESFHVWKRIDDSFHNVPSPTEAWPPDQASFVYHAGIAVCEMRDSAPMFRFHHNLHMPVAAFCFKARSPYLAAGSFWGQRIYVWDLNTGQLVEQYDTEERECNDMNYIDFDSDFIFLANSVCIDVFDRRTRQKTHRIPPIPVDDLEYYNDKTLDVTWPEKTHNPQLIPIWRINRTEELEYRLAICTLFFQKLTNWQAIHYDAQNGHLLALSRDGFLLWTPRYRQTFRNNDQIHNRCDFVVLYLGERGTNLCVENHRAVFTTTSFSHLESNCTLESVYVLELKCWSNHADFLANRPKLTMLESIIPSVGMRVSRLEMDSTSIFATTTGRCLDPTSAAYKAWKTLKQGYTTFNPRRSPISWFDLDGKFLCHANLVQAYSTDPPCSKQEWHQAWRDWTSEWRVSDQDSQISSVIAYSFVEDKLTEETLDVKW
ncbi:hypothetical protein CROQUDRAFT_656236 [Cronartium quercuum f. sp. fusiforme G11]|uniref:F-box domain-containing protein n=1 Tax=Cronartium quercuum f. sp. fusiforme G11 TaxID=708437 RepID=A0A9P6NHZ0_9BASI|nr:hypothetical protein CROQUDRAFT_656236 [Cronartium quercuum f. sp. fusiforme G11]